MSRVVPATAPPRRGAWLDLQILFFTVPITILVAAAARYDPRMSRAVVLLSGGLDSATAMAVARSEGYEVYALSVDYGQRHRGELDCAATQARLQGAKEHRVVRIDLRAIG